MSGYAQGLSLIPKQVVQALPNSSDPIYLIGHGIVLTFAD